MKAALSVTGLGLLTPVGYSPMACMHSVRSGVTRLALQPIPDRVQQWIAGGRVPWWTPFTHARHLEALARAVIDQAWQYSTLGRRDSSPARLAVFIGAPELQRPGFCFPDTDGDGLDFIDSLGLRNVVHGEVVRAGSCQAHVALQRAAQLLERGIAEACVIAAADSLLQIRVVRWLEDQSRLKCSYVGDGLMPAEGAGCVVVEPEELASRRGARVIARVASVASMHEAATVLGDQPNTAGGLTAAVRAALEDASVAPSDLSMVWSDLNGESYRAREWAFTEVRMGIQTHTELMHPADCHGDLGTSTDVNLLAMAAMSLGTGWSSARPCLVFAGSELGIRGASVLTAASGPHPFIQVSNGVARVISTRLVVPDPSAEPDLDDMNDPLRADYDWQVREEHRDDLAGLYYQRKAMCRDRSIAWRRVAAVEQRMLNHVDAAAMLGGEAIGAVCAGLQADDEGEAWAAAMMIGVLPVERNFARLDEALHGAPTARLVGMADALIHAPRTPPLSSHLDRWLRHARPEVRNWALEILAGRVERGSEEQVIQMLGTADTAIAACRAAMRLVLAGAQPALEALLEGPDHRLHTPALEALLVIDPAAARQHCRTRLQGGADAAAARCLAMLGHHEDAALLAQLAAETLADARLIDAVGIVGALSNVPLLLDLLESPHDDVKAAAGRSLALLSGAALVEIVDPAAAGDDNDALPVERPTTSASEWRQWWAQRQVQLAGTARWRLGRPFSLESCIQEMLAPTTDAGDRERAHAELLALSRQTLPYSSSWFVVRQETAIHAWQEWWSRRRP